MTLLLVSFCAGVLTVAAPCILPLLPVVIGGSIIEGGDKKSAWKRPVVIAVSLGVSVIIFSLLLKASTALLGVPQYVWSIVSGIIVITFGVTMLFPVLWEKFMVATKLNTVSNNLVGSSLKKTGYTRDILLGASLGPVFSSCSPTYALIVAVVLPQSFIQGLTYLVAYALGLAGALLCIAFFGQKAVNKLGWLGDPHGTFKKVIGVLFILVGIFVLLGWDKSVQSYILDQGWYDPISKLEQALQ